MILQTPQKIYIQNEVALRDKGRGRFPKGAQLGVLVLAGLGMIIILLSGCGSDSTPKNAASGEKDKAAKSGVNMQTVKPLLFPKEGGPAPPLSQSGKISEMPPPISDMPPLEELEAKRAAAARAFEMLPPQAEVLPGLTKEQLEAKLAEERARKSDPNQQILPGLTQGQLDAKLKAHRKRPSTPVEIFPGLTEGQVKAKAAQARQMQEVESARRPEQVVPK
jgi:hypothetical protein